MVLSMQSFSPGLNLDPPPRPPPNLETSKKKITIKLSLAADEISAPQEPPPLYVRVASFRWGGGEREKEKER